MDKDTVSFNQPGSKFNQQSSENLYSDVTVLCRRLVGFWSQFAALLRRWGLCAASLWTAACEEQRQDV